VGSFGAALQPRLLESKEDVRHCSGARPHLAERIEAAALVADRIDDGSLSRLFVCGGASGRGRRLDQSLPHLRLVGTIGPLTQERTTAEARRHEVVFTVAPELAVDYVGLRSHATHVMTLEALPSFVA